MCIVQVIAVASEAPLIQTVFNVGEDQVHPVPPGEALIIRRSGQMSTPARTHSNRNPLKTS